MRKRVVVHGRVQGVFFRDSTRQRAEAAGVAGWVANRPGRDGRGGVRGRRRGRRGASSTGCSEGPRGAPTSSASRSMTRSPKGLYRLRRALTSLRRRSPTRNAGGAVASAACSSSAARTSSCGSRPALLVLAVGYRVLGEPPPEPPPVSVDEPPPPRSSRRRTSGRPRARLRARRGRGAAARALPPARGRARRRRRSSSRAARPGRPTSPARTSPRASRTASRSSSRSAAGAGARRRHRLRTARAPAGPISLASATQAQLEELDGIGPTLAARIIEYRDAHGGFRSVEELGRGGRHRRGSPRGTARGRPAVGNCRNLHRIVVQLRSTPRGRAYHRMCRWRSLR